MELPVASKDTVRTLTLIHMSGKKYDSYRPILTALEGSNLDVLTIRDFDLALDMDRLQGIPNKDFESMAKSLIWLPK